VSPRAGRADQGGGRAEFQDVMTRRNSIAIAEGEADARPGDDVRAALALTLLLTSP